MFNKTAHPLYGTWVLMKYRCENPNSFAYENYGGRGIRVCDRWSNSFDAFVEDMGERPEGHTLDRYPDNDGNYSPQNCRWATNSQQMRNTRAARFVVIEGVRYHVADLQDQSGINMRTIYYRAKQGWPLAKVLSPLKHWNYSESIKKAAAAHAAKKRATTHCKRGHEFTPENTYTYKGSRSCLTCKRAWEKYLYYNRVNPIETYLPSAVL